MYDIIFLVCTKQKSLYFKSFLKSFSKLNFSNKKIKLIIVENTIYKTQTDIIKKYLKKNISFSYYKENKIGIPFARNKALKISEGYKTKYICFFDDDCEINKNWINKFYRHSYKNKIDIVTGPQIPKTKNEFVKLLSRKKKNKSKIKWAATNNVIFRQDIIKKEKIKFSNKLFQIGGSDQLFFMQLSRKGYKIEWCSDLKVFENIPKKRQTLDWFVKRNFRYGVSSKIIYTSAYGIILGSAFLVFKFIYELVLSLSYLLILPLNRKINFFKFLMYFTRSFGTIIGTFGFKNKKYI